MTNSFKLCPTHFSRGGEIFSRGSFASPNYGPGSNRRVNLVKWEFSIAMLLRVIDSTLSLVGSGRSSCNKWFPKSQHVSGWNPSLRSS